MPLRGVAVVGASLFSALLWGVLALLSSAFVPGLGRVAVLPGSPPLLRSGRRVAPWPRCVLSVVFGGCRACPLWGGPCLGVRSLLLPPFVPGLSRVSSGPLPSSGPSRAVAVALVRRAGVRCAPAALSVPSAAVLRSAFALGLLPLPSRVVVGCGPDGRLACWAFRPLPR